MHTKAQPRLLKLAQSSRSTARTLLVAAVAVGLLGPLPGEAQTARGNRFERKANKIGRELKRRHLPHGTIFDPVFASPDSNEIVDYQHAGDAAIWTGHYIAAESFHFAATGSPKARANVRRALSALKLLVDVTGNDVLARAAVPVGSPWESALLVNLTRSHIFESSVAGTEYYWTTGMADWATIASSELFSVPPDTGIPQSNAIRETVAESTSSAPSTLAASADLDSLSAIDQPIDSAPTARWSPDPVTPSTTPLVSSSMTGSDHGTVQRVAAKMPKPLWLVVNGVVTGLSGLLLVLGIVTIPFAAVVIWMAVMLFKANTSLENARRTGSLESLEKAASNLNTYFAIITIVTALSIFISAIVFITIGVSLSDFSNF